MIALIRYTSATMLHSHRYLPPVLLSLALVGISSSNDSGPPPPVYALCAGALFVCATWLTTALINKDGLTHRTITVVNSGSSGKVLLASVSVAVIGCLILAVTGVLMPLLVGTRTVGLADLISPVSALLSLAVVVLVSSTFATQFIITRKD